MDIVKIAEDSGKSKEEIEKLVKEKQNEFTGVSEAGILRLVAKELGVDVSKPQELKIGNIVPNMRNLTFYGKITDLGEVREFSNEKGSGRVRNITIEDETGKIRMSFWNDEIDKFNFEVGDVVKVERAITRKDNFENPEARLGFNGSIEKTDTDVKVAEPKKSLENVEEGDDVEVEATILEIFNRGVLVYKFCPECNSRLMGDECPVHGSVEPDKRLIVSGIVDDGKNALNAVFFRDVAEKMLGKNTDDVYNISDIDGFLGGLNLITKKFKIRGTIRKNKVTGEIEVNVKSVEPV
jgi:replication factor A1